MYEAAEKLIPALTRQPSFEAHSPFGKFRASKSGCATKD
jgi:hypothetical protein